MGFFREGEILCQGRRARRGIERQVNIHSVFCFGSMPTMSSPWSGSHTVCELPPGLPLSSLITAGCGMQSDARAESDGMSASLHGGRGVLQTANNHGVSLPL